MTYVNTRLDQNLAYALEKVVQEFDNDRKLRDHFFNQLPIFSSSHKILPSQVKKSYWGVKRSDVVRLALVRLFNDIESATGKEVKS